MQPPRWRADGGRGTERQWLRRPLRCWNAQFPRLWGNLNICPVKRRLLKTEEAQLICLLIYLRENAIDIPFKNYLPNRGPQSILQLIIVAMWRKGWVFLERGYSVFPAQSGERLVFLCWKSVDWPWTYGFISDVLFPLVFMSVRMAVPYWLHYCSFIGSFEVNLCNSFNFVLLQISLEKKSNFIDFFFLPPKKVYFSSFWAIPCVHICLCKNGSNKKVKMEWKTLYQRDPWGSLC